MNIKISTKQFNKLKNKIQLAFNFKTEIVVRFGGFNPDTYYQPTFVYLDEMPKDDVLKLNQLKSENADVIVKLVNVHTLEEFEFPLEKISFTKSRNIPKISNVDYDKIKNELKTHKVVLDPQFLKKKISGFPNFITKTLFNLYPKNIGKNSFTTDDTPGRCESENGLINIPNTNVPGETWSILNYFDTNPMVIKKLIDWYMTGEFDGKKPDYATIENFQKWITDNSTKIFKEGNYLSELVSINLQSYNSGKRSENLTIEKLTKPPFNIDINNIKKFCSGSRQDRRDGKDIEITTETGVKYAQIKPLTSNNYIFNESTKKYELYTYGMKDYKKNPINYIIFTNSKNINIFDNKDYIFDKNDLVKFTNPPLSELK